MSAIAEPVACGETVCFAFEEVSVVWTRSGQRTINGELAAIVADRPRLVLALEKFSHLHPLISAAIKREALHDSAAGRVALPLVIETEAVVPVLTIGWHNGRVEFAYVV